MKKLATILLKFVIVGCVMFGLMALGAEPVGAAQIIGVISLAFGILLYNLFKSIIEPTEEIYDDNF